MKKIGKNILLSNDGEEKNYRTPLLPLLSYLRERKKEEHESEHNFFERSCKNKVHFSKKEAQTRRNELRRQGIKVREYECDKCNTWHLTHQEKYK